MPKDRPTAPLSTGLLDERRGGFDTIGAMTVWRRLQNWFGFSARTAEGGAIVIDERTHRYLHSTSPNPSQASLDELLAHVDRVRVTDGGMSDDKPLGEVLLDVSGAEHVRALVDALRIVEDPKTFGHCMCLGDGALELFAGSHRLATLGLHHGIAIRWGAWKHDAKLREVDPLLEWFTARGVHGPRERFDAAREAARQRQRAAELWFEAMPRSLRPFWPERHDYGTKADPELAAALAEEFPDLILRAAVLFEWFGCGSGPWTGYPSYESTPELLLLELPLESLVEAASEANDKALEGAARLFAGHSINRRHPGASAALPEPLRRVMLERVLASGHEDNRSRAQKAFG